MTLGWAGVSGFIALDIASICVGVPGHFQRQKSIYVPAIRKVPNHSNQNEFTLGSKLGRSRDITATVERMAKYCTPKNKGGVGFLFWNANNDYSKPYAAMPEMRGAKGQYFRGDELPGTVQASPGHGSN
jgi:hypothetical protein